MPLQVDRHGMISVVEYDQSWTETFERLRAMYSATLEGVPVLAIEHVGSTAVEGLAAKPIIDIDIVVGPGSVGRAADALGSIGFRPQGELGVPGRWAFAAPDDLPPTHTYVMESGGLAGSQPPRHP